MSSSTSSSRKKQDEKNLKTLRDLASLPHNKYCFDCNQRGPTYVNVTVGSFVCTKCSGLLRGITPPHRVKSISMATFTPEEIDLLKSRGNDYCRRTWMGLYEGKELSDCRDEQVVRDLMVDKYERKRYYLEPSAAMLTNGIHPQQPSIYQTNKTAEVKPLVNSSKLTKINGTVAIERNKKNVNNNIKLTDFVADFGSANIYNAINSNKDSNLINKNNNNNNAVSQSSFANFDNSVIFNSSIDSVNNKVEDWNFLFSDASIADMFPKCNINKQWSISTTNNGISKQMATPATQYPPSEDRYAALKDLDNALREQPQIDWSCGSNGSSFGSITPTSSIYSSPSPHSSMYGSPSQGQFASIFSPQNENGVPVSNPFNNGSINWTDCGNQLGVNTANPFRQMNNKAINGAVPSTYSNGTSWNGNPFSIGTSTFNGHSNNPFL